MRRSSSCGKDNELSGMRLIKDYDRDANKNSDFDVDDAADVDVDLHAGDIVVVETRLQFEDGSRRKRDHV